MTDEVCQHLRVNFGPPMEKHVGEWASAKCLDCGCSTDIDITLMKAKHGRDLNTNSAPFMLDVMKMLDKKGPPRGRLIKGPWEKEKS